MNTETAKATAEAEIRKLVDFYLSEHRDSEAAKRFFSPGGTPQWAAEEDHS
jgi:hypothetical protein